MFRKPATPAFQHSVLHAVLGELSHRGHRGGRIMQHRSLWALHLPRHRLLRSLLLTVVLTGVLLVLRETIATLWSEQLVWWLTRMELPGRFVARLEHTYLPFQVATPVINLLAAAPEPTTLMFNALGVAVVWWASAWLPDVMRPACYLLRFGALIHGAAVFFFWMWPASFPHSVNEHINNGLQQCWVLMLLAPWIHLLTYYLFGVGWGQRLAVTLLTWAYLMLLAPLLYAVHALALATFGLIVMPLLHLMFGVMVAIIGFVAIYGWAMAWANTHTLQSNQGNT